MAKDLKYFNEGYQAYWDGESTEDPPYHLRDTKGQDWLAGWKKAKKADDEGTDPRSGHNSLYYIVQEDELDAIAEKVDLQLHAIEEQNKEAQEFNRQISEDTDSHTDSHYYGYLDDFFIPASLTDPKGRPK